MKKNYGKINIESADTTKLKKSKAIAELNKILESSAISSLSPNFITSINPFK